MKCQAFTPVQASVTGNGLPACGRGESLARRFFTGEEAGLQSAEGTLQTGNRGSTKEQALALSACSPASPVCSRVYTVGEAGLFRVLMGSGCSLHLSSTAATNFILSRNLSMGPSLAVQWSRSMLPRQGAWVRSLLGELRSHMLWGQKIKNIKKNNK